MLKMNNSNDSGLLKNNVSVHYIDEEFSLPAAVTYILIGLNFLIVSTSLIGNGIVLLYFLYVKKAKTRAKYFLVALAISDVLLVIWHEPFVVLRNLLNFHWIFGQNLCSIVYYIQTACVIQRSFALVASCIDRYIAIRWPLKKQTPCLVVVGIVATIWIISLLLAIPVAIFRDVLYDEYGNTSGLCQEVWPNDDFRLLYSITLFIVTFVFPLLVLGITNGHIILILNVKPPGEVYEQIVRRRRAVKRKAIKVFLLAFFAYIFCWLPINAITIAGDISPQIYDSEPVHILWLFAQCLAVGNSAISPVLVLTSERKSPKRVKKHFHSPISPRREVKLALTTIFPRNKEFQHKNTQGTSV